MERRNFVVAGALGVAAGAMNRVVQAQIVTSQGGTARPTGPVTTKLAQHPEMKYRELGQTGEYLSLVGLGGFHLAKPGGPSADDAVRIVRAGVDSGITFMRQLLGLQ